jgi:2-polyprenyl-3-methyl-5-hydroxy-6-metoxy-1,4-benzoquinol methylase
LKSDGIGKPHFEAIVSSEVIEHLDPPDLSRYWEIHLGAMKPDTLIVTTPNRDFNIVFETVEKLSNTTGQSYWREGVSYRMRHDDHRFEYTRLEFEEVYFCS